MNIDDLLDQVISVEGGYSFDPNDPGGETIWGVTAKTARRNGYTGPMRSMPRSEAVRIYKLEYVYGPGFDHVWELDSRLGHQLIDTGINMGQANAGMWLQRCLNALNRQGKDYPDLKVDGDVGARTLDALRALQAKRGALGLTVLNEMFKSLRAARYVEICEGRPSSEEYIFGWFANRVLPS